LNDVESLINELTLEEKAALVSGTEFWKTNEIPRLSIPSMYMTDGPCGLRKQGEKADHLGLNNSEKATCFPTGATVASSWNEAKAYRMGEAIADECHMFGVNMVLGPSININKNPRCGRSFEYFSEDPYLSGRLGISFVKGVQSRGIGTSVKHFAANDSENYRFMGDSVIDERALHEIYLKPFKMVVMEGNPTTVMSAYNKINGTYCSKNRRLLTEILRDDWGFSGAVISDWGGVIDRVASISAGLDLEMPGDCEFFRACIIEAVNNGTLPIADLDAAVRNVLNLIEKTTIKNSNATYDEALHNKISEEIAVDGAVLMKNKGSLPLNPNGNYLVIGDLFQHLRYQGAGSSMINPSKLTTPKEAFDKRNIDYAFAKGYAQSDADPDEALEDEAIEKAKRFDTILVFGGLTDLTESEGYDREHISLPANQLSLLEKLITLNKKIVFVMYGGSPVELLFDESVNAILNMYLPGQAGGEATAKLLFGEVSPSGKLPETWANKYEDILFGNEYSSNEIETYKESIYVGYRYFDKAKGINIKYPFGFGLSYTTFAYSNMKVANDGSKIKVVCTVTNTGNFEGGEIVQLYVKNAYSQVFKAEKELRAFAKIYLMPGESKKVELAFDKKDLSYYNVKLQKWVLENGEYEVMLGASVADIRLEESLPVSGEADIDAPYERNKISSYYDVDKLREVTAHEFENLIGYKVPKSRDKKYITMESPLKDLQNSNWIGRLFYKSVVGIGEKQYEKALKMPLSSDRDTELKASMFLMKFMPNNSVYAMSAASSGRFPHHIASAIVAFSNGRVIKGIGALLKKAKVAKLPKLQA